MTAKPGMLTETPAPLAKALSRIRLEGAIYLRAEYGEPWAIDGQGGPMFAGLMHPGAERLILFHVVASGRCWISRSDGERFWASKGEVLVLPYGDAHSMGGAEPATAVHVTTLLPMPPWTEMPVVRHGGGGDRTNVVCGCLYSEDPIFDPALGAFPPVFVARPTRAARKWVDASIEYALEESSSGRPISSTRLPELLLVEMLRLHIASAPASDRGWIAALRDPVLGAAMKEMHGAPERRWTVDELAKMAAVSRSSLDERFRQVLGRSPISYLNAWRMRIAEDLLTSSDATLSSIAHRIGYDSKEAFSRAFKRGHGCAPSIWRAQHG
jgi:AraC-like DNA-binding protein